MSSKKEFRDYILEQLSGAIGITDRKMMGEYIIYLNGVIIGGIYDDRLLLKKTTSNENCGLEEVIPYPSAKPMYYVTDVDDGEYLKDLVKNTYLDLTKNAR